MRSAKWVRVFGLVAAAAVMLAACGDDDATGSAPAETLEAQVSASESGGTAPLEVSFSVDLQTTSDESPAFAWDFGDGSEATEEVTPTHTYEEPGTYTARVTVTAGDLTKTASTTVFVEERAEDSEPTVTASASVMDGTSPLTVAFTCDVEGGEAPFDVRWEFGDGGVSRHANPSHTYRDAGTFDATCVAIDADGDIATDTTTVTVEADTTPSPVLTATPRRGDATLSVDFSAHVNGGNGTLTYDWNYADGTTDDAAGSDVSHDFDAAGVYDVFLTVTDADGDVGVASIQITVDTPDDAPTADAQITSGECAIPERTMVELDGSQSSDPEGGVLTYEWVFVRVPPGSETTFNNPGVVNPTFEPDTNGDYEIRVFVSDGTHRVASSVVTVTSDGDADTLNLLAGDGQTVVAGEEAADDAEVEAINGCGLVLPNVSVTWSGAGLHPENSRSPTNQSGIATMTFDGGPRAGTGTLIAVSGSATTSFGATIVPADPVHVMATAPLRPTVSDTTGVTVDLSVTDQFGNPTSGTDATFDVELVRTDDASATPSAHFDSLTGPKVKTGVSTTSGSTSLTVYSRTAEPIGVVVSNIDDVDLSPAAIQEFFSDDMEGANNWEFTGEANWEFGVPTSGPSSASSGANVLATQLGGDFLATAWRDPATAEQMVSLTHPFQLEVAWIEFSHWYEMYEADQEYFCTDVGGWAEFMGRDLDIGGVRLCGAPDGGVSGSSGGWVNALVTANPTGPFSGPPVSSAPEGSLKFNFVAHEESASEFSGAGWYVDDVVVTGRVKHAWLNFQAGPPEDAVITSTLDGSADQSCPSDAIATIVAEDTFGNVILQPGTTFDLSVDGSATIEEALTGANFTGPGASVSVDSQLDGEARVKISDSTQETINLTAAVASAAGSDDTAPIVFGPALTSEAGLCGDGVDNDCDNVPDCADPDCATDATCVGEACTNPLDFGRRLAFFEGVDLCAFEAHGSVDSQICVDADATAEDVFVQFEPAVSGFYELCFFPRNSNGNTLVAPLAAADPCGPTGQSSCMDALGCNQMFLETQPLEVLLQSKGSCGIVDVDVRPLFNVQPCGNSCECAGISEYCDPDLNVCIPAADDERCDLACDPTVYCESAVGSGSTCQADGTCSAASGCTGSCDCAPNETCNQGSCQLAQDCNLVCDSTFFCESIVGPGSTCQNDGSCSGGSSTCDVCNDCALEERCDGQGGCMLADPGSECDQVCDPDGFCLSVGASFCDIGSGACVF